MNELPKHRDYKPELTTSCVAEKKAANQTTVGEGLTTNGVPEVSL
jgi:hypothetical protein